VRDAYLEAVCGLVWSTVKFNPILHLSAQALVIDSERCFV
jgi:beta-lactamase regulating signal transducer with metallopeptidase domain